MQESQRQIEIWQSTPNHCKESALNNIITYIKQYPDDLYVSTTSGEPEINKLLIVSERYCYDVIKNHHQWFIMSSNSYGRTYSMPVQELKDRLSIAKSLADALRVAYDYFVSAWFFSYIFFFICNPQFCKLKVGNKVVVTNLLSIKIRK